MNHNQHVLMDQAGGDGDTSGSTGDNKDAVVLNPGTAEYDAYMAALGEHGQLGDTGLPAGTVVKDPAAGDAAVRPDYIPEKFWDTDKGEVKLTDLAAGYSALEKKQGAAADPAAGDAAAAAAAKDTGIDYAELGKRYEAQGGLLAADYEELATAGIPRTVVDAYIAGQVELSNAVINKAHGITKGEENYNAMLSWAQQNKSEAELDVFDSAMEGKLEQVSQAVTAMYSDYAKAVGTDGPTVDGNLVNVGDVFSSDEEMMSAMQKVDQNTGRILYDTDAAYRKQVEDKIGRSPAILGGDAQEV